MNARRVFLGDASRPSGNDDAADAGQLICRRIDRKDVTLNAELANAPREQMTVLSARIQNRNTLHERIITGARGAMGARVRWVRGCERCEGCEGCEGCGT